MGFLGAMGRAMKAPLKPLMKAPGMGAINKGLKMPFGGGGGGGGVGNKAAMLAQRQQPQQPMGVAAGPNPNQSAFGRMGAALGGAFSNMRQGIGPSAPPAPPPMMNTGAPPMLENFQQNDQPMMKPQPFMPEGDQLMDGGMQQPMPPPQMQPQIQPQPKRNMFQNLRQGGMAKRQMY
jgi:hypothetical protein